MQRLGATGFGEHFHAVRARLECRRDGGHRQFAARVERQREAETPMTRQHHHIEIGSKMSAQGLRELHAAFVAQCLAAGFRQRHDGADALARGAFQRHDRRLRDIGMQRETRFELRQ
ncbi:glucokinase [Paraburkholderia nemoris]